jgi:predicted nucleic acid-binding protein
MKQVIVADSSGLFSLLVDSDANHKKALKINDQHLKTEGIVIVPSEILSELINVVGKKFDHIKAIVVASDILKSKVFNVENTSDLIRDTALKKYRYQPKSVSFTDCLVMAFADFYETKEIFGFDEAFRKNGYLRLGIDI